MSSAQQQPPRPFRQGPSYSSSSSVSENYDYTGADQEAAREDEVAKLRRKKFGDLWGGDVPGSVETGGRIRDLLTQINRYYPDATERDPYRTVTPLKRLSSASMSSSINQDSGEFPG